ncbi:3-hydroxyacyl-CoA dehydrogenase family protein [Streptomyces hygroscopicus]|uniref:3-hydroxyacyl-CoA dehydrogenase family protein n=1 Tax=Streptomyces hygroscopicus TaxID=1912 RepID=UPI003A101F10
MSLRSPWAPRRPATCHETAGGSGKRHTDGMDEEYKEPLYAAPPLLQRMVEAGRLGRKTGSGFYTYS